MKSLIRLVFAFVALFSGSILSAEDEPPPCTADRAEPATIEAIQTDFDSWRGKCVAVRGIYGRARLFADRKALVEPAPDEGAVDFRRSIPIDLRRAPVGFGEMIGKPIEVTVIGEVYSCAEAYAAMRKKYEGTNSIWMLGGFCHYTFERYILPVKLTEVGDTPTERLLASDLAEGESDLLPAGTRFVDFAEHKAVADKAFDALYSGDVEAYLTLSFEDYTPDSDPDALGEGRVKAELMEKYAQSRRVYLDIALNHGTFETPEDYAERSYVRREDLDFIKLDMRGPAFYIHCRCAGPDCDKLWPVYSGDGTNTKGRPFVCVHTEAYGEEAGERVIATFNHTNFHFAEPRRD